MMPGFSLHDELANFVDAGFTPMESLQSATSNPAKFLGMQASLGSVEPGKIAESHQFDPLNVEVDIAVGSFVDSSYPK
jgi:N-acetylglucosamine-6-phosphate deacetylase